MPDAPRFDMKNSLAGRVHRTGRSASNLAAQGARELIQSGINVISLTASEPDFDTPEQIRKAAIRAIDRGETRYTTVDGTPELKEAVIGKLAREYNRTLSTREVLVGCGVKHVIFNGFMVTVEEGDEATISTPS